MLSLMFRPAQSKACLLQFLKGNYLRPPSPGPRPLLGPVVTGQGGRLLQSAQHGEDRHGQQPGQWAWPWNPRQETCT